jgi:hypothetical protein
MRARPWFTTSDPGRRYLGTYGIWFESIDTLETRCEDQ